MQNLAGERRQARESGCKRRGGKAAGDHHLIELGSAEGSVRFMPFNSPAPIAGWTHRGHASAEANVEEQPKTFGIVSQIERQVATDREHVAVRRPGEVGKHAAVAGNVGAGEVRPRTAAGCFPHSSRFRFRLEHHRAYAVLKQRFCCRQTTGTSAKYGNIRRRHWGIPVRGPNWDDEEVALPSINVQAFPY
jgi:hypothetical protein